MSSWGLYTDIFRENVFLRDAGIYGSKFNEDFLNTRIAEIRFIRAVNYARMIRISEELFFVTKQMELIQKGKSKSKSN